MKQDLTVYSYISDYWKPIYGEVITKLNIKLN